MANLERRPNQDISPNIDPIKLPSPEESLDAISELVEDFQPKDIFKQKEKGLPSLQAKLEEIYTGEDREKKALLDILNENIKEKKILNAELKEALEKYRGCRWLLDAWLYGPSTIYMVSQLLANSVSINTLTTAAFTAGTMAGLRLVLDVLASSENDIKDDDKKYVTTWEVHKRFQKSVKNAGKKLEIQDTKIRKNIAIIGLDDVPELNGRFEMNYKWLTDELSHFFEQKQLEEELLTEARKRLQG